MDRRDYGQIKRRNWTLDKLTFCIFSLDSHSRLCAQLGTRVRGIKLEGGEGVGTNGAGGWWGLGGVMFPPSGDTRIKGRGCIHLHKGIKKFFHYSMEC